MSSCNDDVFLVVQRNITTECDISRCLVIHEKDKTKRKRQNKTYTRTTTQLLTDGR